MPLSPLLPSPLGQKPLGQTDPLSGSHPSGYLPSVSRFFLTFLNYCQQLWTGFIGRPCHFVTAFCTQNIVADMIKKSLVITQVPWFISPKQTVFTIFDHFNASGLANSQAKCTNCVIFKLTALDLVRSANPDNPLPQIPFPAALLLIWLAEFCLFCSSAQICKSAIVC